jgi:hypothetical protein
MFIRNLLLAVLLSAVLLFAAAWAAGAKTPVNGDEPIVMTKAMYASASRQATSIPRRAAASSRTTRLPTS